MKTSQLAGLVVPDPDDVLPIADVSASETKKITIGDLQAAIGGGFSDKIHDAAGTTRVETEEETDKATVTANGQRVFTMGEDRTDWEAAPDPVTGHTTTEATGAGAYAPGVTGKYIAIRNALNELIGHLSVLRGGPGEGLALLRIMHEASVDSGAGLENYLQPNDGAESVLKARSVLGRGALVELLADDTGVVRAELKGSGLTSSARVVATDESVYFEGHGSAPIHLNEASHVSLPAGMTSLVQGLSALDATKPQEWSPTMSLDTNASSASMSEASWKDEGDFVTIRGDLAVTPTASGDVEVSAPLTGLPAPDGAMVVGVANTGFNYFVPAPVAVAGGNILFAFAAPFVQATRVGFTVTYKKAAP